MQLEQDTIVAIATPPGRGGIGIVRLSGADSLAIVLPMLELRRPLAAGQMRFGRLIEEGTGEALDEVVVSYFAGPRSYTSEDVVEIAAHGSPVLLEYVVRGCIGRGARLAEPGEFTQRAFLSGRLDLTQAEAVHDLVSASTLHQARVAAAQLGGSVARAVGPLKQELVALIAGLEAGVDFAEDDLDLMEQDQMVGRIAHIEAGLAALAKSYEYGRVVRAGFTLAIVGRPNAGKSSLFNRLLERERAIVTAEPGTTRDPIAERLSLGGIPVEVIDTAGLREGSIGEAERLGIERSRMTMAEADLVLHVVDATAGELHAEDVATQRGLEGRPSLLVWSKADLLEERRASAPGQLVSAMTGEGIEELRQAVVKVFAGSAQTEGGMLTNLRQHGAVDEAWRALAQARRAALAAVPHEMVLLDLYAGLTALDGLTGATSAEDVLQLIFSSFCIGK